MTRMKPVSSMLAVLVTATLGAQHHAAPLPAVDAAAILKTAKPDLAERLAVRRDAGRVEAGADEGARRPDRRRSGGFVRRNTEVNG
jgi:hypothetical protein